MPWGRRPRRPSENVACKRDFPRGVAWPEADETSAPRRSPCFPGYFEVMRFPLPPAFSAERSGCRKLRIAISGERTRVLAEAFRLSELGAVWPILLARPALPARHTKDRLPRAAATHTRDACAPRKRKLRCGFLASPASEFGLKRRGRLSIFRQLPSCRIFS